MSRAEAEAAAAPREGRRSRRRAGKRRNETKQSKKSPEKTVWVRDEMTLKAHLLFKNRVASMIPEPEELLYEASELFDEEAQLMSLNA